MCGICGIWGNVNQSVVAAMVAAMHHRGPDDRGVYRDETAALGMSRLAILDLSPSGHQPMATPDGLLWIVYNGEVYNFQQERDLLERQGIAFSSTSDTEIVLRLYERYGDDFLLRLRGMFALAIYDRRGGPGRERLLLARDQLGIKPLLYAQRGSRLIFASELKAMLASGLIEREIDPVALRQLLTFGSVYQPRTMLSGVQLLLPAHRLIIEYGQQRIERYWSLGIDRNPELRSQPYEALVEALAAVLEESVRLQMVSDVPLGAFLSGGIDSSLLVAMMARLAGHRIKTFSVGFEAEGERIDESDDARRTAQFLGTDHHAVLVRGEDVRDRLPHIVYGLDQPSVDGVNSYFVSWAARQAVTVAISGTGGDELFAGYPWFIDMVLAQQQDQRTAWKQAAHGLLAAIARQPIAAALTPQQLQNTLHTFRANGSFVSRYGSIYQIFGVAGARQMLSPPLRQSAQAGQLLDRDLQPIDELPGGSAIERVSALCLRGYTSNQLLRDIDAVSMAHSLEVRVPYLDPVLADLALSLPDSAKLGNVRRLTAPSYASSYRESGAKRILIDVGLSRLPEGFDRLPKRGFAMPFGTWLKGPLREMLADTLADGQLQQRGLLDVQAAASVRDRFLDGQLSWAQPWLLMVLELWHREILDRSPEQLQQAGIQEKVASS